VVVIVKNLTDNYEFDQVHFTIANCTTENKF
jgi:hypothetical protein